jgi:ribonuclease BN (tRNA processing enzyme)
MTSDYFPVGFADLGASIEPAYLAAGTSIIDGVEVRSMAQNHPGTSYAYSFTHNGRKVVYATDSEIDLQLTDREAPTSKPWLMRTLPADLVEFCRGADLLIADAQYTDTDYANKEGWGHSRASTVVDLAVRADVTELALFHHDPMHSDDAIDQKVMDCRFRAQGFGSDVFIFGAREGFELRLGRD